MGGWVGWWLVGCDCGIGKRCERSARTWMAATVLLRRSSKWTGFFIEASTGTARAMRGSSSRSSAAQPSRGTTKQPVPAPGWLVDWLVGWLVGWLLGP